MQSIHKKRKRIPDVPAKVIEVRGGGGKGDSSLVLYIPYQKIDGILWSYFSTFNEALG